MTAADFDRALINVDWSASPDLMSIDDKLTVVFGPMTADERKALDDLTKGLVVGTATYGRGQR